MNGKTWAAIAAASVVAAVALRVSAEAPPADKEPEKAQVATTATLGGEQRFLTHLSTDKPIYKAGEIVYVRGVLLGAHDHKPLTADQAAVGNLEILGPKGDTVASGGVGLQDSVLGFSWTVPEGQAGGEYKVRVTYPWQGYPPAERKFDVRVYRAPRLKSQIEFVRDGYGPGDTVTASVKVERAEGGVPADAKVTVRVRVDGQEVHQGQTVVDPTGVATARFELPEKIARGEGTLSFTIDDGGAVETAAKTIPILLQTVDLQFYPEGGDLVAGLKNRIYLEARTPAQKPADLAGYIVDETGQEIAEFRTEHEGRGRVRFTPQAGKKYALRIDEPAGIQKTFPLPEAKSQGIVLSSAQDIADSGAPLEFSVASITDQTVKLVLRQREQEVAAKELKLSAGAAKTIKFDPENADGVLIATVENADGAPLAERLVFRRPVENLKVSVTADKERYTPGGMATLKIKTTNADGKPVSALVGVTVTDDSVLEMIEKREQAPRLPVMVLLEPNVQELADAHVYLDPKNPEAPLATDLLLGTQGWRRFAFYTTNEFVAKHGDEARRVLALTMPTRRERLRKFQAFRGANPNRPDLAVPRAAAVQENAAAPIQQKNKAEGAAADPAANLGQDKAAPPVAEPAAKPQVPPPVNDAPAEVPADELPQLQQALEKAELKRERQLLVGERPADKDMAFGAGAGYIMVREYAHQLRPDRKPGDRRDFAETLYWHAGIKTDPKTGEATARFALSDAVTSFRVAADAFASSGALGLATEAVESVEPFYVEPKLPLEVTSGDVIELPLGIVNGTEDRLSEAQLQLTAEGLAGGAVDPFTLAPEERVRRLVKLDMGKFSGTTQVVLNASAGPYADRVTRPLVVKPLGFPVELAHGGMLYRDEQKSHTLTIPATVVPGSLQAKAVVYPTPMASLTAALERLIQEPYGCFEQTSSSTYPLVMAQQYFRSHTGVDPALIQRSNEMLAKGYERLTGYECDNGGYEWFGEDPGHEALTAYGLMEFTDMAEVYNVDTAMLQRTRKWLLGQRDGQGGFKRERRALHTWVVDADVSNAYIIWALLSAGETELAKEVAAVRTAAEKSENTYVLALAANVLALANEKAAAQSLLDRMVPLQQPDGSLQGATGSIVGSGGDALTIETTALATLAWLSDPDYIDFADKGVKYLAASCKAGRFGSTQSTVLALKAIVAFDKAGAKPKAPGRLQLLVDGKPVGDPVAFTTDTQGRIDLPDFAHLMTPGEHEVTVAMTGGSNMPYTVTVDLSSEQPASSKECVLQLETALQDSELQEGALTEVQVTCHNTSGETVPMPVAIIGIPGGLEVRHDQLKELVKAKKIAAYEVLGREVVLYWRELQADESRELPVSLVAALPGKYTAPASRTYLYYTDEHKQWVEPLTATIAPLGK